MHLRSFVALGLLIVCGGTAAGQSKRTDSQSLEEIVGEIRQLRQELRTLVGTAQRAQMLIARVQVQESVVGRLQKQADDARATLTGIQGEEKKLTLEAKLNEELLGQADNPKMRKEIEDTIARLRAGLEQRASEEQQTQARLTKSEEQFGEEQTKLRQLQADLDQLERKLQ